MYIYGLFDPETEELRYIGATRDLDRRLKQHIRDKGKTHKTAWIKSILTRGNIPIIRVIDIVSDEDWKSSERYWIKFYRDSGCRLVNLTDGGDGVLNYHHTDETRARMRLASHANKRSLGTKLSDSTKNKMRNAHIGMKSSDETKDKIRNANLGKKHSDESKKKMRESHLGVKKGLMSEEAKEKIRITMIGNTNSLGKKNRLGHPNKKRVASLDG